MSFAGGQRVLRDTFESQALLCVKSSALPRKCNPQGHLHPSFPYLAPFTLSEKFRAFLGSCDRGLEKQAVSIVATRGRMVRLLRVGSETQNVSSALCCCLQEFRQKGSFSFQVVKVKVGSFDPGSVKAPGSPRLPPSSQATA